MKNARLFLGMLIITSSLSIISCGPSIKITSSWVNREKMPAQPIKSVFIIALTSNMELRSTLEDELASAAEKRGLKAYKSMDIVGPVDIKLIAPVKDVFIKKLNDLNCESVFTVAIVNEISETKYVPGSNLVYSPYSYGSYGGYGGYGAMGPYGGFGGYYGYAVNIMSTPGYYSTDKKYFIEGKLFDLRTDDLLLSIQSKAHNPSGIAKASKEYTQTLMEEVIELGLQKK
jgi:hypothetical protein